MRRLIPILLALSALFPAIPAQAGARLVASHSRVRPGDTVVLEWSGLPARSEEVELELSLDGGRWVRISPELDARDGEWRWRVPSYSSAHAQLRLRTGGTSETGVATEQIAALSAEFEIESNGVEAGDDWWHVGEHRSVSYPLVGSQHELWSMSDHTVLFVPESAPAAPVPAEQPTARLDPRERTQAATRKTALPVALPRCFPLRN